MSDVVWVAIIGVLTLIATGILDRRGKSAAASLVVAQAQALKEETAAVIQRTYTSIVDKLQERLTAVELEQNTAIAQHGEMVKMLLIKIDGLNAEIERQSALITSQTAIIADLRDQVAVLVEKLAIAGGK